MGRKSKPLLASQPKLAEVKFGIAPTCAVTGMATPINAISAMQQSKRE